MSSKESECYNTAMETMTPLYSPEDLRRLEKKEKITAVFCAALAVAALFACVTLCLLTTSRNAWRMELACIGIWTLAGWVVLYLRRFTVAEARLERQHAEMLSRGEAPETLRGRVTVTAEKLRIVGSIRITIVLLENESGTRRLKVCTSRARKLREAGENLTLYLSNGYIRGYSR